MSAFKIQDISTLTNLELRTITECMLRNISHFTSPDQRPQCLKVDRWLALNRLNKERDIRALSDNQLPAASASYAIRVRQTLFGSDRSVVVDLNAVPLRVLLSDSEAQDDE